MLSARTLWIPWGNDQLVAIPDCVPSEFERWSKIKQFYQSLGNMESPVEELINDLHRQPNVTPVSCIVADTYLGWAVPLAKKLSLLSISFWRQSISMFSILSHSESGDDFLSARNFPL